jgi:hypothetical protein
MRTIEHKKDIFYLRNVAVILRVGHAYFHDIKHIFSLTIGLFIVIHRQDL